MKNIIIVMLLGVISLNMNAQRVVEKNIEYNNQYIDVDLRFASEIEVKTWDKSTVYFKADIRTKDGKYLDLFKLDIDKGGSTISITSYEEPIFKAFRKEWDKESPKKGYYNSSDYYEFNYVLYVPKNAKFKISSINGSLNAAIIEGDFNADLINGDIEIKKYAGNLDLKTINGAIDLSMKNTSLTAETINGEIYADDKLNFKSYDRHVGYKISGSTDNPKNRLRLNTINGNMYLRF